MKVLMINSVCGIRSTGRICVETAHDLTEQGHEVKIAYGRIDQIPEWAEKYAVRIGKSLDTNMHALRTRILDDHGFGSVNATRNFIKWAELYDPDMVWLHNLHGYYINVELLFKWIKSRPRMTVRWTLHDCWAFTGHCAHFDYVQCDRWKTGCSSCPQKKRYPSSYLLDNSKKNYVRKKSFFTGVRNMTIITPSKWLAGLVKESFLKEYPVEVSYNKIDTNIFKPTIGNFRQKHGLQDAKIILGVASAWSDRKGLYDFYELSKRIDGDTKIVLVGLDEQQMKDLPACILGIQRTNNAQELAEIYSAADIFFNPTYEDTYPTVNLEAQACNTRVITYDTGGAAETLYAENAMTVKQGDLDTVLDVIKCTKMQTG